MLRNFTIIFWMVFLLSCSSTSKIEEISEDVKISNRKIIVNDEAYVIKGICYHPVPKGQKTRSFENLNQDLTLMLEASINTIRVYEPIIEESILDQIDKSGLKVIIGFGYNQGGKYDILSETYMDYVNRYKSHSAILMWELGNEYNYHPEWFEGDINNWYKAMNKAAAQIHKLDKTHPVTTAHGELPDSLALSSCPNIDVWGMNVYRWDNPQEIFGQWKNISNKPMYLSEAGGDSYMTISKAGYDKGVNEKAQADANANILNVVFNHQDICSGVTLFSFTDGWWKADDPSEQTPGGWAPNSSGVPYDGSPNEEYWGIVDIERNKKQTFGVIKRKYTSLEK